MATVADALRRFGAAYLANHTLSTPQATAWRGIAACRTPALGGQHLACDACGHSHWPYHSCRNRHCPQCGARAKDAWLQGRLAQVLPVPYAHLVFTLPHALNGLYGAHPRWVIDTLFACTAKTLNEFAANARWMGTENGTPAFSLVLHTWTQDLRRHIHRTAIGNERIRALTAAQVAFTIRADDQGGKRVIRLDGAEFIGRLMRHVLPTGIKRIRHYGVLAAACKGVKLDAARQVSRIMPANRGPP